VKFVRKMNRWNNVKRSLLVAMMSILGLAVTTTPAQAAPYNCGSSYIYYSGYGYIGGEAKCSSGTGSYRVAIRCDDNNWFDYNRYGPWRSVGGGWSEALCDWGDKAYNLSIQFS
jgi:hypothetical protein